MPPRVSTGDRDAVLRQIRWCSAVQTLVNCHCKLEENPVGSAAAAAANGGDADDDVIQFVL